MSSKEGVAPGLLERSAELAVLDDLLDAAQRGDGGLVVIEGSAGIGKTCLLAACRERAEELGLVALRVRGDELVMESSFAAVRELLWTEVDARPELLDGAAELAASVFERGGDERVDRDRAAAVLHGLYWLVADLADREPIVLLVDDAHWLDAASARFLAYLARRVDALPVLMAVSVRPGDDSAGLMATLSDAATNVLRPEPLSEEAAEVLVRGVLGPGADEELCRACHEATGGNPYYLRELTTALIPESRRDRHELAASVRTLEVGTVARSVLVRLARLGEDCERLAQAMTVLAPGSPLRHAAMLARLEREPADVAADALRAADLFAPGAALSFAHPIVREAIAAELLPSRRATLHGEAARVLVAEAAPADQVAAHLLSAEPYGESWVVDALCDAAREALAKGAPEAAVAYLRRAVQEPPEPDARLDVLLALGRAEAMQPIPHDFVALREALRLAPNDQQRAWIAIELAWGLSTVTRFSEAASLLEVTLERAGDLDPDLLDTIAALLIGGGIADLTASERLLARAEPYFERARKGEISDPVMLASLALAGAVAGRHADEIAALARRALGDESLLERGAAHGAATTALSLTDHLDDAAAAQDIAIAWAQRNGSAPMFVSASVHRGVSALRAGELESSEAHLRRAHELGHELGAGHFAVMFLIGVLLELGEVQEATDLVGSVELSEPQLAEWQGVIVLAQRGHVRLAGGELEPGVADLLDAHRRAAAGGMQLSMLVDWVPQAALALEQLGRGDDAGRLAHRELEEAVAASAPRRHGMALSTSGTLEPGPLGLTRLREAVDILASSPAELEHARALINLGRGLRLRGHREDAREAVWQGLEIAHRCRAETIAARARAELVAGGARPRRDTRSGLAALTPAELRTARMAVGGLTNREIAQALFVSAKTVEAQLSRAYAKLAIPGRTELAAALSAKH
jgi:DNA-binding CsgD family transcriptional regulator